MYGKDEEGFSKDPIFSFLNISKIRITKIRIKDVQFEYSKL
jgi:hypothetical protein